LPAHGRLSLARDSYGAYESGDRSVIEELLNEDFRFYSPADVGIDRARYLVLDMTSGARGGRSRTSRGWTTSSASPRRAAAMNVSDGGVLARGRDCADESLRRRRPCARS
jgi:hypothetical protein